MIASGVDKEDAHQVAHALTPFAASIGKDGAPNPAMGSTDLPRGDGPSGYDR